MNYTLHLNIAGVWLEDKSGDLFTIPSIIKTVMIAKGLSIPKTAETVGVNTDTIYRIMCGQQTSYETMFKLLDAIGVKITFAVCS